MDSIIKEFVEYYKPKRKTVCVVGFGIFYEDDIKEIRICPNS